MRSPTGALGRKLDLQQNGKGASEPRILAVDGDASPQTIVTGRPAGSLRQRISMPNLASYRSNRRIWFCVMSVVSGDQFHGLHFLNIFCRL
jgi:hypothetical protein